MREVVDSLAVGFDTVGCLAVGFTNWLFGSGFSKLVLCGVCIGHAGLEDFQSSSYPSAEQTKLSSLVRSITSFFPSTFKLFFGVVKEMVVGFSGTGSENVLILCLRLVIFKRMFWMTWYKIGVSVRNNVFIGLFLLLLINFYYRCSTLYNRVYYRSTSICSDLAKDAQWFYWLPYR